MACSYIGIELRVIRCEDIIAMGGCISYQDSNRESVAKRGGN